MKPGYVLTHVTSNEFGFTSRTYSLVGGPLFLIYDLRSHILGEVFEIGPFQFRVLEFQDYGHLCELKGNFPSRLMAYRVVLARHWQTFCSRIIMTLAVWGLAEFRPTCVPSWSDVYIIRKIKGLL